jgi:hydrogenase expression/formation protein HypE
MDRERITLAHGSGGVLMHELIRDTFVSSFTNPLLSALDDSAILESFRDDRFAFTTDSFVVKPIFFPGGDIGKLAVCGTINDLAVVGARPHYLSVSFILEEGLPVDRLEGIVRSMARTAGDADVRIVTGDTKVVERGACDEIFVNTTGIGSIESGRVLSLDTIKEGDTIIVSGFIGDHGIAVLSKRGGLSFETLLRSDCAPLNELVETMLDASPEVRWMRDPTRGGLTAALNEMVYSRRFGAVIYEDRIPVREPVKGACEMLGFDPLFMANEGKIVAVVSHDAADPVLNAMKGHEYGKHARIVGEIVADPQGMVLLKTEIGGTRILDMPRGELLPRIC